MTGAMSGRVLALLAGVALAAAGCSSDPTGSEEYRALEAELAEARDDLEAAESEVEELSSSLAEATSSAEDEAAKLERELQAAQAEVAELRLRYDDEIRAELRAAFDAEVARACEVAAAAPTKPVESTVKFQSDWGHLDLTKHDLVAAVTACAGPQRAEAQLTQQEAAAALAPVVDMVLGALRTKEPSEDLPERVTTAAADVAAGAIYEDPDAEWVTALDELASGHACAMESAIGPYCTWISLLEDLQVIGAPGVPRFMMGGGDRTVGTGEDEARPGTWVTYQVEGCYWERLDSRGEIIDNNFVNAAPQVQVTIRAGDFAFNSDGCGRWMMF